MPALKHALWALLICFCSPRTAVAAVIPWDFSNAPISAAEVHGLAVDAGGFLWVSGAKGLYRFDGEKALQVLLDPTPPSSQLYQVLTRPPRDVFVAAAANVSGCDPLVSIEACHLQSRGSAGLYAATFEGALVTLKPLLPHAVNVAAFLNNELWFATGQQVYRWVNQRAQPVVNGLGVVTALAQNVVQGQATVWLGSSTGLYTWSQGVPDAQATPHRLLEAIVNVVLVDAQGRVWVGTRTGLWLFSPNAAPVHFSERDGLPSDDVRALVLDQDQSLWVGTWAGPVRFADGTFDSPASEGLQDRRVTALAADRDHGVWVGFRSGGVRRLSRQTVRNYGTPEGFPSEAADSVLVRRDGSTWALFASGTLMNVQTHERVALPPTLATVTSPVLAESPDGQLWLAAKNAGLWHMVGDRWQGEPTVAAHSSVTLLKFEGNRAWISRDGVLEQRALTDAELGVVTQTVPLAGACQGDVVASATLGSSTWFAFERGAVMSLSKAGTSCVATPVKASAGHAWRLSSLAATSDGAVWAGSPEGSLFRLKNGRFFGFSEVHGLPCDSTTQILDDRAGGLWLTCGLGAAHVARDQLNAVAEGQSSKVTSVHVGASSGMRNEESSHAGRPAAMLNNSGDVWIATDAGVVQIIDTAQLQPPLAPVVAIAHVSADGADAGFVPGAEQVHVTGLHVGVTIDVALPVLSPRVGSCLGHKLLGRHTDVVLDRFMRSIVFPELTPGTHTAELYSSVDCVNWDARPRRLRIVVAAPWYARPTFFLAVAALVIVIAVSFYRLRVKLVAKRYNEVEQERQRIARELHDGLGQAFTALRYQLQAAEANAANEAREASHLPSHLPGHLPGDLSKGSGLVASLQAAQSLLQTVQAETRAAIWSLRAPELAPTSFALALQNAVKRLNQAPPPRPSVIVECDPAASLPPEFQTEFEQVACEALTNALVHAHAKEIRITVEIKDDEAALTVIDDGQGFVEDMQAAAAGGHFGILGMRERMRRLCGIVTIDSSPGHGTTLLAVAPLPKRAPSITSTPPQA